MSSTDEFNHLSPFEVRENAKTGFKSLIATQHFEKGTILSKFGYEEILEAPDKYTIQMGENQHITLAPHHWKFTNHSCNPNIFFDLRKMEIQALNHINPGEELTFFYPSTEWKMREPFNCGCGSKNCLNRIDGAHSLSSGSFSAYRFSDFIMEKKAGR